VVFLRQTSKGFEGADNFESPWCFEGNNFTVERGTRIKLVARIVSLKQLFLV
jgi:hypothetical protein